MTTPRARHALRPGDVTPLVDAVEAVLGPHAHGSGDVSPLARLTGEMVTVKLGDYSHRLGRRVVEEVEMELLAIDGPLKFGERVREARDVDRLLARSSGELFVGVGRHTFACGQPACRDAPTVHGP